MKCLALFTRIQPIFPFEELQLIPQQIPQHFLAKYPLTHCFNLALKNLKSYHPSQFIHAWNDDRLLGLNPPRNAPVYAPVVSGVTGGEGGPSEVVEGPCHGL